MLAAFHPAAEYLNVLGASVMKPDIVLDVQVRAPVTNLCASLQSADLKDRVAVLVMDSDALLLTFNEPFIGRRGYAAVRTICQSSSGLGDGRLQRERLNLLGRSVRMNLRKLGPKLA